MDTYLHRLPFTITVRCHDNTWITIVEETCAVWQLAQPAPCTQCTHCFFLKLWLNVPMLHADRLHVLTRCANANSCTGRNASTTCQQAKTNVMTVVFTLLTTYTYVNVRKYSYVCVCIHTYTNYIVQCAYVCTQYRSTLLRWAFCQANRMGIGFAYWLRCHVDCQWIW